MSVFATLLICHLIADFPLQSGRIYEWKTRSALGLSLHTSFHVIVPLLLFEDGLSYWPAFYALALIHYLIDWGKLHLPIRPLTRGFLLDQISHGVSLIPLALLIPSAQTRIPAHLLPWDLFLLAIPAFLLIGWTATLDIREPKPDSRPHTLFTWVRRNALRLSQGWGLAMALWVAWQVWG
jgi:hypothetical protein